MSQEQIEKAIAAIVAAVQPKFPSLTIRASHPNEDVWYALVLDYKGIEVMSRVDVTLDGGATQLCIHNSEDTITLTTGIENVEAGAAEFAKNLQAEIEWLEAEWPRLQQERASSATPEQ